MNFTKAKSITKRTLCILTALLFVCCASDPMKDHYTNWKEVTKALMGNSSQLKACKTTHGKNIRQRYVIYTFNIIKENVDDVVIFNDPYKLQDNFHSCIKITLTGYLQPEEGKRISKWVSFD